MALEVGIVGLPNSGKTTLFNALTRAGAEITAYTSVTEKPNVGMAAIADDRLPRLAALVVGPEGDAGGDPRRRRPGHGPGAPRQPAPGRRDPRGARRLLADATPADDLETLQLELLVADRDHVERRHERVAKEAKSGDAGKRTELETLAALLEHLDAGKTLADWPGELPPELDPLTTKPLLAVENGPQGIDCKLEAELADLPEEEAAEFRDGPSALDEVVRRLKDALGLIAFFTVGDKETRAWTLRDGQTALEAAATIHTDIARGFIRCEVILGRRPARAPAPTPRPRGAARSGSRARRTSSQTATS